MERSTAKVFSKFYVRFADAYCSVNKVCLHKKVVIHAIAAIVKLFSREGELLAE